MENLCDERLLHTGRKGLAWRTGVRAASQENGQVWYRQRVDGGVGSLVAPLADAKASPQEPSVGGPGLEDEPGQS